MERRKFIQATALVGSGMFALKNLSSTAWAAVKTSSGMPYGPLGRTGVQVSKLAVGTAPLARPNTNTREVAKVIHKALDEGINYMDTAPNYTKGEAERRLGHALKGKRDQAFVVTKTEADTYDGTMELLEQSLRHLQTDHVDLVHLHNLGHLERWKDLDFAFSEKGAMGALRKAKEQGKIRFIGASGHLHPSRFHYAIDSGEIDVLMNAVNFVNQHTYDFEHKVWTRALEKNIGLVSMKVLGGDKDGGFRLPDVDYENAIRYTLSLNGLSTAVIGLNTMAHLDQLLDTFHRVDALDEGEFLSLSQRGLELLKEDVTLRSAHGLPLT